MWQVHEDDMGLDMGSHAVLLQMDYKQLPHRVRES